MQTKNQTPAGPTVVDGVPEAHEYLGEKIMPLHAIDQPLVDSMQAVIKKQNALLETAYRAMTYLLRRSRDDEKLRSLMYMTEAESQLVKAVSAITGENVKTTCAAFGCFYGGEDKEAA